MQQTLHVGFRRQRVWSPEAAWLVESAGASMAELSRSLPPTEALRWVRTAGVRVSDRVEQGLRDQQVLVLVERIAPRPFHVRPPVPVDLADLAGPEAAPAPQQATDFIEVQVVDSRGRPRPSVRYILRFPNGSEARGTTNADGMLRYDRLRDSGDCELVLPDIQAEAA